MDKKKKIILITVAVIGIVALIAGGIFAYQVYFSKKAGEKTSTETKALSLDPAKEATHLSKLAGEKNAYWMRGFPIVWNSIEKEKGKYDWKSVDEGLSGKDDYFSGETYHIAMIWPYANWDQKACHSGEKYKATGHLKEAGEDIIMGAPCDFNAYANFVEKAVERYDGDGEDDMPGLKIPIKYWEIMNEPEMQGGNVGGAGEDLKFFVGSSQEYLEILKKSYAAIKKADSGSKVAHAGMAGMQQNFQDFWNPIFSGGAGSYFDIANIHTINTDQFREDMFVTKFKEYLAGFGIVGKPIWVTEVQFGDLMGKPKDVAGFEKLMARSSVFASSRGADRLFYIENWTMWDNPDAFKPPKEGEKDKKEPKPKIDLSANSTHKVYKNLLTFLNSFDKVEVITEQLAQNQDSRAREMGGVSATVGQYKFTNGKKVFYVLWGNAPIPLELTGKLNVTDIYGASQEIDATSIKLTDSPIFVTKN